MSMLSFSTPTIYQSAKCFATYGKMGHPDLKQLPTKGKPWSALLAQDFVHQVDLVLPQELLQVVQDKILQKPDHTPVYQRVIMTLGQILQGEFFTEYVKIGDIMMLSEGRVDTDNVFSLKNGVLTMYLEKETYERAGLVGQPHGIKGKRGDKPRWIVQFDLRSPSMLHGKKGFDRLAYACKNVLNTPLTWLFCNLSKTPNPDPLAQHFPAKYISPLDITSGLEVAIPTPLGPPSNVIESGGRIDLDEYATDMYEWLSLVRLESPRVHAKDNIDGYLSRYVVPSAFEDATKEQVCKLSWQGFISPTWTRTLLADVILAVPPKSWFAMSATSLSKGVGGDATDCTILRPTESPGHFFLWDIKE